MDTNRANTASRKDKNNHAMGLVGWLRILSAYMPGEGGANSYPNRVDSRWTRGQRIGDMALRMAAAAHW